MASSRNSPPADLAGRVSDRLRQFVRQGDRVVAALSGGVDSVVLLHLLVKLQGSHRFLLSALHVHHGLSPDADRWQAFCVRLCEAWGVGLETARVEVERDTGEGLEAAARHARYRRFAQVEAEWLALAHQRDDQAETLLFNLLRGTGVGGAAAMPLVRDFPGGRGPRILRPLLDAGREEIEAYAREADLAWVRDESNADTRYARNFLRLQVFPLLRSRFPGCDAVLARAAAHFAEGEELLEQLARLDAQEAMHEGRIVAAALAKLDEARARNLMRYALKRAGIQQPDAACLREIVRQVCHAAPDRRVRFQLGERELHRFRGEVWIVPAARAGEATLWRGEAAVSWGGTLVRFVPTVGAGVSRERLAAGSVAIAPRRGGERIRPDCRRPRRELKKLLQEFGVPPWRRAGMPLLWCGEDLAWAPEVGIDCTYQCSPGEPGWEVRWEVAG